MQLTSVAFVKSSPNVAQCPPADKPEYAFVGRSNVGKSSLLNCLVDRRSLAKTSGQPGKTRLINHYLVNDAWYLVDLPGYGFAKVSQTERHKFKQLMDQYLRLRENLMTVFVLVDCRVEPQESDLNTCRMLGEHGVPLAVAFTKIDKLSSNQLRANVARFSLALERDWDELPPLFYSSATDKRGREDILQYIAATNALWVPPTVRQSTGA